MKNKDSKANLITEILDPDEILLWHGKPFIRAKPRSNLWKTQFLAAIFLLFFLWIHYTQWQAGAIFPDVGDRDSSRLKFLQFLSFLITPFLVASIATPNWLKVTFTLRNEHYFVTNKRAIIWNKRRHTIQEWWSLERYRRTFRDNSAIIFETRQHTHRRSFFKSTYDVDYGFLLLKDSFYVMQLLTSIVRKNASTQDSDADFWTGLIKQQKTLGQSKPNLPLIE